MFNFQKMSGTERVKKEQSFFSHKEAKMSFLCYFQAKKVISMKNKIHDKFISPYRPRTIHIYDLPRWKIPHIDKTPYLSFPKPDFIIWPDFQHQRYIWNPTMPASAQYDRH